MRALLFFACVTLSGMAFSQESDSVIRAQGKIIHGDTREPVVAKITYQSLPYGNRVGIINNSTFSFPMFDNEKYSITVEAPGFAPVKYMLDPTEANAERVVVKDIELTSPKAPVENKVHEVGHVMRLTNLIFQQGKAKIDPESYSELDLVVDMMRKNPSMVIQLEGHTDYLGDAKENMKLSEMRVQSVKEYLVTKKISKNRIKTVAYGGTQPLSRDNTPEAHRLNRRVELRILKN